MNSFVVGIDLGEKESLALCITPDGDIRQQFKFPIASGYSDIAVAHPRELSWITKSRKKNDRGDSLELAKLNLIWMIPESHFLEE